MTTQIAPGLIWFAATDKFSAVLAMCAAAYSGVRHQRLLVMAPEYLLVADELDSRIARRLD